MLRNLAVTGVVSVVMAVMALAFRSAAPSTAQPAMGEPGKQPASESPMDSQTLTSQVPLRGEQVGQTAAQPPASTQIGGGMMGGGQTAGGMMMCPCMQMMMQMMGSGTGEGMMGGQMNQPGATAQPFSNPRTKEQAQERAEQYLNSLGNPNLKVGELKETAASYEIEVVTKDDSLMNRLIIDKKTGELKSQY